MRGRKPTPPELKKLRGNPGHRPMNKAPAPVGKLEDPPPHLTPSQVSAWRYAITHAPAGVLSKADRSNLVVWVVAEDYHRQASEKIAAEGLFLYPKVKGGEAGEKGIPYQHPAVAVVNRQALIMLRAAAEMGFTPSSRSRVNVDDALAAPGGVDNEFAEFSIN
jgi:P27 family predicted phage terminase small subunit